MEMEVKHCDTCMHETLPSGIAPCCNCIAHDEWKPKGEFGPEMITPEDITSANQFSGTLAETARAMVKQITRLDYAIVGVRSKIGSIGIRLTDKDMSLDEIAFLVGQLNMLQCDLFELEREREAVEHVKDRDS